MDDDYPTFSNSYRIEIKSGSDDIETETYTGPVSFDQLLTSVKGCLGKEGKHEITFIGKSSKDSEIVIDGYGETKIDDLYELIKSELSKSRDISKLNYAFVEKESSGGVHTIYIRET